MVKSLNVIDKEARKFLIKTDPNLVIMWEKINEIIYVINKIQKDKTKKTIIVSLNSRINSLESTLGNLSSEFSSFLEKLEWRRK